MKNNKKLISIYQKLKDHFGFQHWWPGETPFEVMIGAILTQNTAWSNVEKAIRQLKEKGVLDPEGIKKVDVSELAGLIRPSGYYNQKAERLKGFVCFYEQNYSFQIELMKKKDLSVLRKRLLEVKGIGKETADSILLYAASKKIFVIDAYTKRIFFRLGFFEREDVPYDDARVFFEDHLPRDLRLFKDYHAQIVMLGKHFCRKSRPLCMECPLKKICKTGKERNVK